MKFIKLMMVFITFIGLTRCSSDSPVSPRTSPPIITNILNPVGIYGGMKVSSVPNDAVIIIDGVNSGKRTPFSFEHVEPKNYVIRVRIEGYISNPDSISLKVPVGKRIGAHFDLTKSE